MEIYLVGGAVRDQLLGLPAEERDWVVVGATPEEMTALGYRPVGRDFPVFLHPRTNEEYALARTERKTGRGYRGFSFQASPDVTLVEDLQRRDLTINAIAQDESGQLIDPYGGQRDLEDRLLRHVSSAFNEDPVRALRVARFAARFQPLGFRIAEETRERMREMVRSGEMTALIPERVFQELRRALMEPAPQVFVEVLVDCGAWSIIFPLLTQPQRSARLLLQAAKDDLPESARFSCLSLDAKSVASWCKAIKAPRDFTQASQLLHEHLADWRNLSVEDPSAILDLIAATDGIRRPERFEAFCRTAQTVDTVDERRDARKEEILEAAQAAVLNCDEQAAANQESGQPIPELIRAARLEAVRQALQAYR